MKKTGKGIPEWTVLIKCKLNEDPVKKYFIRSIEFQEV